MKLIVGLGNPGIKYKKTRHNVGFLAVDEIQKMSFPKWQKEKKFKVEISKGRNVILAKPQTYMNNSGQAVKKIVTSYKLQVTSIYVIHDDLDLTLGKFKLQKGRGSAGHKGVQSIIDTLGTKDFWRLRIGIRPTINSQLPITAEQFVLEEFTKKEEEIIKKVIKKALKGSFTAF